jgi:DNA-binding LytR/AlgR family response regulator
VIAAAYVLKFADEESTTCELVGDPTVTPTLLIGEREHRLYPLNLEKIDYIQSDGNYVSIYSVNTAYIRRDSMRRLAAELADSGFVRIERSLLVNIRAVLYAETVGRGRFAFTLSSGTCLHSSASYRDAILRTLPLAAPSNRRTCRQSTAENEAAPKL